MKKLLILAILTLSLSSVYLLAEDNVTTSNDSVKIEENRLPVTDKEKTNERGKTRTSLHFDEDGNINPDVFKPFYWGEDSSYYSGIGFGSTEFKKHETIDGFDESRSALSYNEYRVLLNLVTYEKTVSSSAYSIGAGIELMNIKRDEFGYFQFPTDYAISAQAGEWETFDNEIELNIIRPHLYLDYSLKGDALSFRATSFIFPLDTMSVKQKTRIKPLITTPANHSSTERQGLGYKIGAEVLLKPIAGLNINLLGSYSSQPIKYDYKSLAYNSTASKFEFQNATSDSETKITNYAVKFQFPTLADKGASSFPTVGYGSKKSEITYKGSSDTDTKDTVYYIFGLEKSF